MKSKKHIVLFILCLLAVGSYAQQDSSIWQGFGKFRIGADISTFENDIEAMPDSRGGIDRTCKDNYLYIYNYKQKTFGYAGVKFTYAMLFFNKNNKLVGIDMGVFYRHNDSIDISIALKNDIEVLGKFVKKETKKKGKLIHIDDNKYSKTYGLKWNKKNSSISVQISQNKDEKKDIINSIVSIGLWTFKCENYQ